MSQIVPYEDIATAKKIPSSTKILELLGKSDLVKERYAVSVQPYSGQGAGIGAGLNQKIQFKMFNNSDYVDLQTAYLTFQSVFSVVSGSGGSLNHLNFEDNVLSWFVLVRTLVNDQVLEEVSSFNIWANLITYASMSKSYYESAGSFQGLYRHSTYLAGGAKGLFYVPSANGNNTLLASTQNINAGVTNAWQQFSQGGVPSWNSTITAGGVLPATTGVSGNDDWVNRALKATTTWCCPLSGVLGLFSIDKYFPLRSVSSITLELNLPTNIAGIVYDNILPATNTAVTNALVQLSIQQLYLHYDCVKMSDAYYELMDSELIDPNGMGVQYTVNTVECIPATVPVGNGKKVLIASKGTRFLKAFYAVQVPSFAYQSGLCPPSSIFVQAGFQQAQLIVNSKRFPQYVIDSVPRAFSELMKSMGKYANIVGDSVITYNKVAGDVASGMTSLSGGYSDLQFSNFILGLNLEQVLDAPEITLSGENTLTAGFQIQLELTSNTLVPTTCYMFPHFAKVLRIKGGSVAILN